MSERHDPDAIIAAWLDEGPTALPPVTEQVIASSLHVTPQRRRWLIPLPWRDHTMFMTPARLMAAAVVAVILAGSGTAFLIGHPNPSDGGVPAAEATTAPSRGIAYVSGTGACSEAVGGETGNLQGLVVTRGATFECTSDVDDPRVSGAWTSTWNTAVPAGSDDSPVLWWGTSRHEDDQGAWECSWVLPENPGLSTYTVLNVCRGSEAYEGLTYVFEHVIGGVKDGVNVGYIYEGQPLGEWAAGTD